MQALSQQIAESQVDLVKLAGSVQSNGHLANLDSFRRAMKSLESLDTARLAQLRVDIRYLPEEGWEAAGWPCDWYDWWPTRQPLLKLLKNRLLTRAPPPIFVTDLSSDVEKLVGVIVKYLLPFKPLQHLEYPFAMPLLLAFFIPHAARPCIVKWVRGAWKFLALSYTIFISRYKAPESLYQGDVFIFRQALQAYLAGALKAGRSHEEAGAIFYTYFRFVDTRRMWEKKQELLELEILEAILRWKERKNDEHQQRLKQA
jgi:hypothetical protein